MGSAEDLPLENASFDIAVSGLVLNFVLEVPAAFSTFEKYWSDVALKSSLF